MTGNSRWGIVRRNNVQKY